MQVLFSRTDALFTLFCFHLDPFLLPKMKLSLFPIYTTLFSDRNGCLLSLGVHICPQNHLFDGFFYIGSVDTVFNLFLLWCSI